MWALLINDFKMLWNNKISLSIFIFLPLIILMILSTAMSPLFMKNTFIKPFKIAVVDHDMSVGSRMAISSLQGEDYISRVSKVEVLDEEKSLKLLKEGQIECVVIVPEGFSKGLYYGENKPIKVYISNNSKKNYQLIKGFIGSSANLVEAAQGGIYTVYHLLLKSGVGDQKAYEIAESSIPGFMLKSLMRNDIFKSEITSDIPQINPAEYYMICVSIMFIMFSCIIGVVIITKDYENGVISKLRIAPLGTIKYLFEKIILILSIGVFEFLITLIPASIIFKIGTALINLNSIIAVITIILTSTAFCIMISLAAENTSYAVTSSVMGLFIFCLVGGSIFPTSLMTDSLKAVSDFSFVKWGINALAWSVSGSDFSKSAASIGIMLVFSFIFFVASWIVFTGRKIKLR